MGEEGGEFGAEGGAFGGVEGVKGEAEETEGGDERLVESAIGGVFDTGDVIWVDEIDNGATGEGVFFVPVGSSENFGDLDEGRTTAREKDAVREGFEILEIFDGEFDAGEPDGEGGGQGFFDFFLDLGVEARVVVVEF